MVHGPHCLGCRTEGEVHYLVIDDYWGSLKDFVMMSLIQCS
jgi:hypothetical protein